MSGELGGSETEGKHARQRIWDNGPGEGAENDVETMKGVRKIQTIEAVRIKGSERPQG